MSSPRPRSQRMAAGAAIACLVFGFPVLIVALALVDDEGRRVVTALVAILVVCTFAGWLYTVTARRNAAGSDEEPTG